MNDSPGLPENFISLIWAGLMVLLFLTWGLAELESGPFQRRRRHHHRRHQNAAGRSSSSCTCVTSRPLTWIFVAAGFFWLFIMMTLTMANYASRGGF